ncbi:rhamnan synthesis F family protein [Microbacterium lacticum]
MKTAELVVEPGREAQSFPEGGKRVLIYVVYDRRGDVEDYIAYALDNLRDHVDTIIAVVNGVLTERGRDVLDKVADRVLVRENRGFDIWGYKDGIDALGEDLSDYDELILANDTWYGPVGSFAPVFDRMDRSRLHFWGMTDHVRVEPNPFTNDGYLAYHLQSYWLAVRKEMFQSPEWRAYWRDLPRMDSYSDAVAKHEAVFTERFTGFGFVGEVAFPTLTDRIENHAVLYPAQLVEQGCPTLKRRAFFQWPPYLDHLGVIGKWGLDAAERHGYPMDLIWTDLARNVAPHTLNADAALLSVLPGDQPPYDPSRPMRTVVIAHVFYEDMLDEILARAELLPGDFDLVVTAADENAAGRIRQALAGWQARGSIEVRAVTSNNGRDQSAFLIDCRDVVRNGGYDLLVKIHSKRSPQDASNAAGHFKAHQFDNLLGSTEAVAAAVSLFQHEPRLGIAYPPMVHVGYGTIGHAWWANRPAFVEMCAHLGIRVPVDEGSPLAPFGSMYIARPQALEALFAELWSPDDFGDQEAYVDGGLAHVLERIPSYAAGESGYYTRTIATATYFSVSHTALEYDLDQFTFTMPDTTMHQINFLQRLGQLGSANLEDFAYIFARTRLPYAEPKMKRVFGGLRRVRRALSSSR